MEQNLHWQVHLNWMLENQPEMLWQLHQQGKLRKHLDNKFQEGLEVVAKLREQGMTFDQAFEVATDQILAPSDGPAMGDNPPNPLPSDKRKQVLAKLSQ